VTEGERRVSPNKLIDLERERKGLVSPERTGAEAHVGGGMIVERGDDERHNTLQGAEKKTIR